MQFIFHSITADLTWHGQDSSGRERSKTRRRISRYPQVDLVFASSRRVKISGVLGATLPKDFFAAVLERVAATILHTFEQCFH